ncbi:MAG: T9SS type A sorting domain-containing protein [Bacteroidia bacterium]
MKKIYVALLSCLFAGQVAHAQLTLTKAFNEPVSGNTNAYNGYDSLAAGIPKNTGAGLVWNFSACPQNTATSASTFTTPASVPNSANYPGVTVVEDMGGGNYNFYKSATTPTTQFEFLGVDGPNLTFSLTNSAIQAVWPVNFGYSKTDNYSGTITAPASGNIDGTVTVNGSGTGSVIIPGGTVFSNVLQIKTVNTLTLSVAGGVYTGTIIGTDYNYYHSSQKFPILQVSYQKQTFSSFGSPTVSATGNITVNSAVITGLNDKNFEATFQIFPNPAKDYFNVNLTNAGNATGVIEIYNGIGALVKVVNLGNASTLEEKVSLSGLSSGIYIVKTTLGARSSARRLIVE